MFFVLEQWTKNSYDVLEQWTKKILLMFSDLKRWLIFCLQLQTEPSLFLQLLFWFQLFSMANWEPILLYLVFSSWELTHAYKILHSHSNFFLLNSLIASPIFVVQTLVWTSFIAPNYKSNLIRNSNYFTQRLLIAFEQELNSHIF